MLKLYKLTTNGRRIYYAMAKNPDEAETMLRDMFSKANKNGFSYVSASERELKTIEVVAKWYSPPRAASNDIPQLLVNDMEE